MALANVPRMWTTSALKLGVPLKVTRCYTTTRSFHMHARASVDTEGVESREAAVRAEVTRRIQRLGREGRPKDAVAELASMARIGIQPDTQAATALLDACMRSGKIDMAETCFDELFADFLIPDEVTFLVLIRGYGSQDPPRWSDISDTLNMMQNKYQVDPSASTFTALLETCARTNDGVRGEEIITRMIAAGVEPDDYTWDAVKGRKTIRSVLKKHFN